MVILNYNDANRAIVLAEKCGKYNHINKVIIVDNCSTDSSWKLLNSIKEKNIDVIKSKYNGGFAAGNNIGAKYAIDKYNPEFILFANTDVIFEEFIVEKCIEAHKANKEFGLISTLMIGPDGKEQVATWNYAKFHKLFLNCFWIYRKFNINKTIKTINYPNELNEVNIVRGSFMFFKRKALESAKYFDENTFLYGEEAIISKRLYQAGFKVGVLRDIKYIHNHLESIEVEDMSIKKLKMLLDSSFYFQATYCDIDMWKKAIFYLAIRWAVFEQYIINKMKSYLKN